MSISTLERTSAYPSPAESLLPQARVIVAELGHVPSRNHLMRHFSIGAPKATELRDLLNAEAVQTQSAALASPEPDRPHVEFIDELAEPADPQPAEVAAEPVALPAVDGHPDTEITATPTASAAPAEPVAVRPRRKVRTWPVLVVGLGAFIAIWAGWVELGKLTGFGIVHPLPGIWDSFKLNTAIVLPLGMDAYAAFALKVWLTPGIPARARRFARWSAISSLVVGMAGQVAYHLMAAQGMTTAPWQITTAVSCLPVIVLGLASALAHLVRDSDDD
jgi:hypothetical protein